MAAKMAAKMAINIQKYHILHVRAVRKMAAKMAAKMAINIQKYPYLAC